MKTKLFISAVTLLIATSVSAQFQTNIFDTLASSNIEDSYDVLYFQYNPQTLNVDNKGVDDLDDFNGITFGWKKGFRIDDFLPFFVEPGLAFQYSYYNSNREYFYPAIYEASYEESEKAYSEEKITMGAVCVSLNGTYRCAIPNTNIMIAPYLGLRLKCNLWAKDTQTVGYKGIEEENKIDLFDKDDMGGNNTANRLQVAWQIGVNVNFKKVHLGIGYGKDLGDFLKKTKFSTTYLTLGFNL